MTEPSRKPRSRRRRSAAPKADAAPEAESARQAEPASEAEPAPDVEFDDDAGGADTLDAHRPAARTLTPAVIGAAAFVVICALASIAFVASRGGLALPLASPSAPPVAIASPSPSAPGTSPTVSPPVLASPSPAASSVTSPAPASPGPTPVPSSGQTPTPDPLTALPACPNRTGCYLYTVRRGDTLGRIADRFSVPYALVLALNPEISNPSIIVIGQEIRLGRSLFAGLEPCPNRDGCHLYVVQPGDRLSTIAGRYGLTVAAILELNPAIDDPNTIYSGQVIRLPDPTG